jgi:8-oxo-dGTP pyrophosphatase MutT (NUDIX family)
MTEMTLADLVRRLALGLPPVTPVDDSGVVFGPGERHLAETYAEAQRRRIERQGIVAPGFPGKAGGAGLRPAAVLMPLVAREEGVTVLLTVRTADLAAHAGQISFPGGRLEPEDADARAAALRETEEEIGLTREHIEVLGEIEEYGTVTGFRVTPVIGVVTPPFVLAPDPTEVAGVFEVPLAFILDPANRRHAVELRDGVERDIYEILFGEFRIWGFTARLLVRLVDIIEAAERLQSRLSGGADATLPSAPTQKG